METTVFISRHSFTLPYKYINSNLDILTLNMMQPLTIGGEQRALKMAGYFEFKDVDIVLATAKYVALEKGLFEILRKNRGKKIYITSHSMTIFSMFQRNC